MKALFERYTVPIRDERWSQDDICKVGTCKVVRRCLRAEIIHPVATCTWYLLPTLM